jgi:hypothetical protein
MYVEITHSASEIELVGLNTTANYVLQTTGAKLFSSHAGAPTDGPLLDTDPNLYDIQKAQTQGSSMDLAKLVSLFLGFYARLTYDLMLTLLVGRRDELYCH